MAQVTMSPLHEPGVARDEGESRREYVPVRRSRWRDRRGEVARLVVRRTAVAVPMLIGLSAAVFVLAARSPLDPLAIYLGSRYQQATEAQKAEMARQLGFEASWWQSWSTWVGQVLQGDLGWSRVYSAPVTEVIVQRLPWTILLSATGLALAVAASLMVGTFAGMRPGSWLDRLCSSLAVVVQAMPPFVLALGMVAVFAVGLRLAPVAGASAPGRAYTVGGVAAHLVLPAITLALTQMPWMMLAVRTAVVRAVRSEAVRGARARGIGPIRIAVGHVLPVSLAPLVTIVGARLPELVVGAVLVEEIFGWPGLAGSVVASAQALDFALLATLTVATTASVLLGSLLADATYLFLDPRVSADV